MIQMLLKTGLVEASTSLIAGLFKSTLVGYAAGGAVQAVSMAYLAHVSGHAFADYFRHGQSWGDGGMGAALIRQFDLNSRADFLQEFRQAGDRPGPETEVLKKADRPLLAGANRDDLNVDRRLFLTFHKKRSSGNTVGFGGRLGLPDRSDERLYDREPEGQMLNS